MPTRYYEQRTLRRDDLPKRQDYLSSVAEPVGIQPGRMSILRLVNGLPNPEAIVLELDFLTVQAVNLPQEERFQPVATMVDDGQAFFLGRTHRVYSVSGFIIDTNLSSGQGLSPVDTALSGRTLARWKRVYQDELRASAMAANGTIARLIWRRSTHYGYVLSAVASLDTGQPDLCQISLAFFSVQDANVPNPGVLDKISGSPGGLVYGTFSIDTLGRLDILSPAQPPSTQSSVSAGVSGRRSAPPSK